MWSKLVKLPNEKASRSPALGNEKHFFKRMKRSPAPEADRK